MMQKLPERRGLRSDDTRTAITYQLAYSAVQAGMDGLVLADGAGVLVGASPSTHRPEEIAAFSPLALNPDARVGGEIGKRSDVTIQCFDFEGARLLLIGLGGMSSHRAGAMVRSMHGVVRILRTSPTRPALRASKPN